MKYIEEPARKLPIMAWTHVLETGSDPAGLTAAFAATRQMMCCAITGQGIVC